MFAASRLKIAPAATRLAGAKRRACRQSDLARKIPCSVKFRPSEKPVQKTLLTSSFSLLTLLGFSSVANAATAYWSFQVNAAGTTGGGNLLVKEAYGFASTPTLSVSAGTGQGSSAGFLAGGVNYISPFTSTTYAGASTTSSPGYSMGWSTPSNPAAVNNTIAGASFTISVNTLALSDFSVNFDIRSATASSAVRAPGSFSAIEYSLDNGANWVSTGITSPTWANSTGSSWSNHTINLSSVSAINNQENVQLRFTFANAGVSDTIEANMNIRVDNLLVSAVPEPASLTMAAGGALFLLRRRRSER
jgi:hypothetical protein